MLLISTAGKVVVIINYTLKGGVNMLKGNVRILALILCAALLFMSSACGSKTEESNKPEATATDSTQPESKSVEKPEVLEITKNMFFGDASDSPELKSEYAKIFEEKYGIKLKLNALPRNNYMEKLNLMLTSGSIKGIVVMFGPSDVLKSIDDEVIEPVDEYLSDNKVWNSMPEEYKNLFKYDGKTWAFGMSYKGNYFTRWIRKDWLDNLGLNVPETMDDLYKVSKAFVENDPDKNGKNDTGGLVSCAAWNIQDIFQAFGARIAFGGDHSISWHPESGIYEDAMLNPGMIDALKYINKMYKEGYLDKELFTNRSSNMREKIYGGKFGSTFYWAGQGLSTGQTMVRKTDPNGTFVEIPGLKGTATKNVNQVIKTGPPYVLVKGTKQPKEVVNAFFDIFFGSEEGYLMGKMGIEEKSYKMEEDNIIWMKDASGSPAGTSGIVDEIPMFSKHSVIIDGTEQEKTEALNLGKQMNETKKAGYDSGLLYDLPGSLDSLVSKTWTDRNADILKLFQEALVKATTGELSAEDAVAQYKEKMKSIGADKVIKELNDNLGKATTQTY